MTKTKTKQNKAEGRRISAVPILLPLAFALNGILYSFPAADLLTFILSLIVILRTYQTLQKS